MEFRNLKVQYRHNKKQIDSLLKEVIESGQFIGGSQVKVIEQRLAEYVGVKHCITCANGTDALQLALMSWHIGENDAVFVPDFTFFASGEVVSAVGATPIFVDVDYETCNISTDDLEKKINIIKKEGILNPKAIIAVDLFGQPADFTELRRISNQYSLYLLEDGAQGFGGRIGNKKACSFGDVSTTSFFPAKPLGCYGDGGAIFTNSDSLKELIESYKVHGKGSNKYENIRIGMNSRLDSIQAAVLNAKLDVFVNEELDKCNKVASLYSEKLNGYVELPHIREDYYSSWAQYTIKLRSERERDDLCDFLKTKGVPSMVYYPKPMHLQKAFSDLRYNYLDNLNANMLCKVVLSLPFGPYMSEKDIDEVTNKIKDFFGSIKR